MSDTQSPQRLDEENLPLRLALVDIYGTLVDKDGSLLPGCSEALEKLRKTVPAIRFVTNDSKKSALTQIKELAELGITISEKEFISALTLTKLHLKIHRLRPLLLVSAGAAEDFDCMDQNRPNCVVVGDPDDELTHEKLNEAVAVLSQPNAQLLAVDRSRTLPTGGCNGCNSIGAGAYVAALEYASEKSATLIGRPSRTFWNDAVQSAITIHEGRNNITSYEQAVMIGDDVYDDIIAATDSGMNGILVQTGVYKPEDDAHCADPERARKPLGIVSNFPRAVDLICSLNEKKQEDY